MTNLKTSPDSNLLIIFIGLQASLTNLVFNVLNVFSTLITPSSSNLQAVQCFGTFGFLLLSLAIGHLELSIKLNTLQSTAITKYSNIYNEYKYQVNTTSHYPLGYSNLFIEVPNL